MLQSPKYTVKDAKLEQAAASGHGLKDTGISQDKTGMIYSPKANCTSMSIFPPGMYPETQAAAQETDLLKTHLKPACLILAACFFLQCLLHPRHRLFILSNSAFNTPC